MFAFVLDDWGDGLRGRPARGAASLFGSGELSRHGLVCVDDRFRATWRYPRTGALPLIYDCYALNVDGEAVCFLGMAEAAFHLVSVRAGVVTDHGMSPIAGSMVSWSTVPERCSSGDTRQTSAC